MRGLKLKNQRKGTSIIQILARICYPSVCEEELRSLRFIESIKIDTKAGRFYLKVAFVHMKLI